MPYRRQTMPKGSERILLVDDEASIILLIKRRLENLGYEVEGVTDPKAALKLVQVEEDRFDLVITDMVMPGMSGAKLAETLLKHQPGMPVILCSGYSSLPPEEIFDVGIRYYIEKPIDFKDLACCIRQAIDRNEG